LFPRLRSSLRSETTDAGSPDDGVLRSSAAWFPPSPAGLTGRVSQTFAVSSPSMVTIRDPSGLNAAYKTLLCPLRVRTSHPTLASHTVAVWPERAVTIREPSGLNDTERGEAECPLSVRISAPVLVSQIFAGLCPKGTVTIREPSRLNDAELIKLTC